MANEPKTYEELRADRAREWNRAQAQVMRDLEEQQAKLMRMPDVMPPESPWDTRGDVICACGAQVFRVARWRSVNGKRYRAELDCVACKAVGTWDFGDKTWLR